jgi:hypothetical protein
VRIELSVARHPHPQQGQHIASPWIKRVIRHSGQQPASSVRPAAVSRTRGSIGSPATALIVIQTPTPASTSLRPCLVEACWRSPRVQRTSHEKCRGRGEVTDQHHLLYSRPVRAALAGLIALTSGAAVGFATWNLELQSLPPGCKPCTGTVCSLAACVVQWPRLTAVATLLGLVATTLVFVAIRRLAR